VSQDVIEDGGSRERRRERERRGRRERLKG
jgi:hypothetical protein